MVVDPATVTDTQAEEPVSPDNKQPAVSSGDEPAEATGVQFGPEGPSVDVFHKPADEPPSVFDIELPETVPLIRIRVGEKETTVSFWTLFDLCTKYEEEFTELPWEAFVPVAVATLGVEKLDIVQWRVLLTRVEELMKTTLKKNFRIIREANALRERNPATSSDSPKP